MVVRRARTAITCAVIATVRAAQHHRLTFNDTKELSMAIFDSPRFLRYVLFADSASCIATGAAQVLLTGTLADMLHLPAPLLLGSGFFLLAYAALAGAVATREPIPRAFVWLFVGGNFAWAAGCVALLMASSLSPSAMGQAWILAQAVTVVVLAELQWTGLRRAAPIGWA
jgi:hypothetical protein